MMETKLWIALCALLVINLGAAEHNGATSPTPGSTVSTQPIPVNPVANPVPGSSHNLTGQTLNSSDASPSGNSSLSVNINETISMTSKPGKDNDHYNISHPATSVPEGPTNPTQRPSEVLPTTSHPSATSASATLAAHTSLATVPSPNDTASHQTIALPANSTDQPSQNDTSTPEPPQTTTHATTSTQVSSTVATTPSHENPTSAPTTNNSQSHGQPEPCSEAAPKTTPTSSTSTQAKTHSDTPSQLNVEGDTTMVHDSPALDPLLAGLVSAFIITAVIITLLLFLKLRRRDNRPEFRRLQDLPMDDMMEDTPLSMYSY